MLTLLCLSNKLRWHKILVTILVVLTTWKKKIKVAEIVSGKRKSWHDPPTEIKQSHVSPQKNSESRPTHSPMKDVTNIQLNLPGMPAPASATKKICFSFTSNNANIQFSYDV